MCLVGGTPRNVRRSGAALAMERHAASKENTLRGARLLLIGVAAAAAGTAARLLRGGR